jgi:hypothetical protein
MKAKHLKKGMTIETARGVKTLDSSSAAYVGPGWRLSFTDLVTILLCRPDDEFTVLEQPSQLDTFIRCARCNLLVWQGTMPGMTGIAIPCNHEPVECEGVALPSENAVCPGSEMLGPIVQGEPTP